MIKKLLPYLALATSVVLFSATYFRSHSEPTEGFRDKTQAVKSEPVGKVEIQAEPTAAAPDTSASSLSAETSATPRTESLNSNSTAPARSSGHVLTSREPAQPVYREPVYREPVSRGRRSVSPAQTDRPARTPERPEPAASSSSSAGASSTPGVTAAQPEQVPDYPGSAAPSSPDYPRDSRRSRDDVYSNPPDSAPPPPARQERVVIPAGTEFIIRTLDRISSEDSRGGERFAAAVENDIHVNGRLVIPARSEVTGKLVNVTPAGRVSGRAEMVLALESVIINGETYNLRTNQLTKRGESSVKEDTTKVAAGAAIGAVLGAITGGKRGAVVGATMGGGAGTIQVMTQRGKPVRIGPETELQFKLEAPLEVTVR